MSRIVLAVLALTVTAAAAPVPVRNPFWPQGHEGTREVITAQLDTRGALAVAPAPKVEAKPQPVAVTPPVAPPQPPPPEHASDEEWTAALHQIKIGGRIRVRNPDGSTKNCILLDGKSYADGDVKNVVFAGRRFAWKIQGLNDSQSSIRLDRLGEVRLK